MPSSTPNTLERTLLNDAWWKIDQDMIRTPLPLDTLPRLAGENDQILDKILNLIVNGDLKLTQRDPGGCGGSGRRAALAHARPDTILQNVENFWTAL